MAVINLALDMIFIDRIYFSPYYMDVLSSHSGFVYIIYLYFIVSYHNCTRNFQSFNPVYPRIISSDEYQFQTHKRRMHNARSKLNNPADGCS